LNGGITNAGAVQQSGWGLRVSGGNGAAVNLAGALWDIQDDSSVYWNTGSEQFYNQGTLRKSGGMGTSAINPQTLNSGTLDVQSGTVLFNGSPTPYAQTEATMNFGLSNSNSAGRLSVSGNINLDGTLSINTVGAYAPAVGDTFSLVSGNSLSGVFGKLNLPVLPADREWQVSYNATSAVLGVVPNTNAVAQILGAVTDNLGHAVTNLGVFAFTTNAPNLYVSGTTDANGNYALNVTQGAWTVGLQNLPSRGYNAVMNQTVAVSNASVTVNFVVRPYTGPTFIISAAVNPAGAGTATGGGTFAPGASVTLNATANTNPLPYIFNSWTENGVFQSASSTYSFSASRNRQLVANFVLPVFAVTATNNPAGAGTIDGAGSYFYGQTSTLTAHANFGYSFSNWTEEAAVVGNNPTLSTVTYTNHAFVANYNAANLIHVVTTATLPSGLAAVAGAGTYTNGQTANFSAPVSVTNSPYVYSFQQYTLSNTVVSTNAAFSKTFSTLDSTNLQYVAVYSAKPILPVVTNFTLNFASPVPATTNLLLSFQFDRSMNTNVAPAVQLTNMAVLNQPSVGTNGYWTAGARSNDTYVTAPITLVAGMDGTNQVFVSGAQDLIGATLALTNVSSFVVDATPPPAPALSILSSNAASSSVAVGWSGYPFTPDLNGFRIYLQNSNFSSVSGLSVWTGLGPGARNFQFDGLSLDTPYYVAVQAFDVAGNNSTNISPSGFKLASTVPPPVTVQQAPLGASSAVLSWNGYDTSALFGFAGFRVYYAQTNFTSISGMSATTNLPVSAHSFQFDGLDRTKAYYFAVVGFNGTNGFNSNVTTASWNDPYSGNIALNTSIGGSGQGVVNIYGNIVVVSNATLTIQPGTTLLFAPGTGLTVQQGALVANGTALAPIIFDSANDLPGSTPGPGDWAGVTLGNGASSSVLGFVEILYGSGLTVSGCSPLVDAFTAQFNSPYGLGLQNGATLTTSNALIALNNIGAQQTDTSSLTIQNSVIQNNGSNAVVAGSSAMAASADWWGSAVQSNVIAQLLGNVSFSPFLTYEPVLTPAIGTSNGITQVGNQAVNLQLACRTADSMRLSEDYNFTGVFFSPFTNYTTFPLSAGGGLKRIYAQFRSITGQTNAPLELDVNYVTGGPVIQSFSFSQGQTLNRPVQVTGTASAVLGMQDMEFYVDGVLKGTNAGSSLSQYFDIRNLGNAIHEVELIARDTSGNVATLQNNVVIAVTPPLAPLITVPASDILTNTNSITISGTAEPGMSLMVTRNGQVVGNIFADTAGNFTLPGATLVEGDNLLSVVASDTTGVSASAARHVTVETMPPAQLVMNQPVYTPGAGLGLTWQFPASGKQASTFEVFWSASPFSNTNQATGHSIVQNTMFYNVQALANGTYYFGVVGFDLAGNPSPLSALVSTVYDASPPALNIAYSPPPPVGVGPLNIVVTSSKALAVTPSITIRPAGAVSPILLNLTNVALNTWQTVFNVTAGTPTGPVTVLAVAQDQSGNVFNGAPTGPQLVLDVIASAGRISTVPPSPIQDTNSTNISVSLLLTKSAGAGTMPSLVFTPPTGASVSVPLGGSGSNWNGTLAITPGMGAGFGQFSLSAQDSVGNIGSNILSGGQLELYNTAQPSAPAAPTGLSAVSLAGGNISLSWNVVSNAQIYRIYREPGTNPVPPVVLVMDNITTNVAVDLPPSDGPYRYGVTASRLGAESGLSNVVVAISDRTPPPAPTNVAAVLAASGVQISWQEPVGTVPDHYNIYRNGTLIRSVAVVSPVVDYPPSGTNGYVVAAADALGNENPSAPATLQLLVAPVNNLSVLVSSGQATTLSWASTDGSVVGFNLYRNGIKQNAALLTGTGYVDNLPMPDAVQYAVTAVNGSAQESPARLVTVQPVGLGLLVNAGGGTINRPLLTSYFDKFQVGISNLSVTSALPVAQIQLNRTIPGLDPLTITNTTTINVSAGTALLQGFVVPEASIVATQTVKVSVLQQTDSQGSTVSYQQTFTLTDSQSSGTQIAVSANQLPMAGGLTPFQVQVFNRGYTDMQLVVLRGKGTQPGDVYISVQNALGQEVSRTPFLGVPPGTTLLSDGRAYVNIAPGASLAFAVSNVLVPAALTGQSNVTFVAVASSIYNQIGTPNETVSGPLSGSMVSSSLATPPYYGTAQTDKYNYVNDDPIVISGQALDSGTGLPVANVPLNIGFGTRGFKWYQSVTTDRNGSYQYTFNPPPGFGGTLMIWAAHPLVVDQLNQAPVIVYRVYASPSSGDVQMGKNDSLSFPIQLINPGDLLLTGFTCQFSAYQMSGTNQIPVAKVTGTNLTPTGFSIGPNQSQTINLQLSAAIDAPDNLEVQFTFTSAEGASATFTGNLSLYPAVPVLTVTSPAVGYLEMSLDRGDQKSGQITVVNSGLRDLQGVTLTPPTNVTWMKVNLPVSADGQIRLPDVAVGQSNTFSVVFTPPGDIPMDFYQDAIRISGTNAATPFQVNVYALVTSALTGAVQFEVDDILGQQVGNAAVRLRNTLLQTEVGPFYTDTNGFVTITNLQEGTWSWQVTAQGYPGNVGSVSIVPDQTVQVSTRLSKSLVTVNFSVTPVPFTDTYEINVEQTFETQVPVPVLVMSPSYLQFDNVQAGFEKALIVNASNEGLEQMTDFTVVGTQSDGVAVTPLITYLPVLLPQQTIDVPFIVRYDSATPPSEQASGVSSGCLPPGSLLYIAPFKAAAAMARANARCPKDNQPYNVGAVLGVGMFIALNPFLAAPILTLETAQYVACLASTKAQAAVGSFGSSGGGGGGGSGTTTPPSFPTFQPGVTPLCPPK
jgi:fibronectin type 3 domain-containing protein